MVEFIRDVIVVVAILVTLIALAFHPASDLDAGRNADTLTSRISAAGSIKPAADVVGTKSVRPVALTK